MTKVTIDTTEGEHLEMRGGAIIGIVINPEAAGKSSATLMAGTTNVVEVVCSIADAGAALIDQMAKDPLDRAVLTQMLTKQINRRMLEEKKGYVAEKAEIRPAKKGE